MQLRYRSNDCLQTTHYIFDREPSAAYIMDELSGYHSLDIQWGNHDIFWMGAASGCKACICNVIRNSCKYNNLRVPEDGYGINLIPLAAFALEFYKKNYCDSFMPAVDEQFKKDKKEFEMIAAMHKAITIIQLKLEGQLIQEHSEYQMGHRRLLDKIDYQDYSVIIEGNTYPLKDTYFPTVQYEDPYKLTVEEAAMVEKG
jgi:fructose-1,6-bisphosphatase-3